MLSPLGLSTTAEAVYRAMLHEPTWGVGEIAESLNTPAREVHGALDELIELSLVRESLSSPGQLRPTSPAVGLAALLAQTRASLAQRQHEAEATQVTIDALAEAHSDSGEHDQIVHLDKLDTVRDQLAHLARLTEFECLSLNPGGAHRPDAMAASKPVNQVALERGVSIKAVYQDSFRNDPDTLAYARWFTSLGAEIRTVPLILFQMVIVDRTVALLPLDASDPRKGAIEVRNAGIMVALCALFDQVWSTATPFGCVATVDGNGLYPTERELLRMLGDGDTDDAVARKLGLSPRTVQRLMADLTQRLGAESRFQAGANAVRQRWL